MTLSLIAALVFLLFNVFFVFAEFSLVRTQIPRLEVMRAQGRRRAALVLGMVRNMDRYLSAIQIGVTMCTLGVGWTGEPAVSALLARYVSPPEIVTRFAPWLITVAAFALILYFQIVFAELVPRAITIRKAEVLALWLSVPLEAYYQVFRLPTAVLSKSALWTLKALGISSENEHDPAFSEDEVRVVLGASQEKGLLPLDRLLLIENLFDLASLKVRDAMVTREKIVFLSTAASWEENRRIVRSNHFSRYPLGDPGLDRVVGLIHVKDLAMTDGPPVDLRALRRRIATVPESAPLQPLLKTMAAQGTHMLLCLKGPTTVSGLLTLEDVLEEVVGEILDEFDAPNAWSLHQNLHPDNIDIDLHAATPREAIHALAARLKVSQPTLDVGLVEEAVNRRESQLPTAIGKGVAVPHARLAGLTAPLIAIGRSTKTIGFVSPDKVPVRLVFLLLTSPAAPMDQLRILSRVATIVKNGTLLKQMLQAKSPGQLLEVIRTSEAIVAG